MESRRAIQVVGLLIILSDGVVTGQSSRDDWKPGNDQDVEASLIYSLADAPLSAKEREGIYRLLDNQNLHDSFTDAQRNEEHELVMGARVGFIHLAQGGARQVLVEGSGLMCGASGNCPYLLFIREAGRLRLVLRAGGNLLVRNTSSRGFQDVVTAWHMSGFDEIFNVYRWNGTEYKKADCYTVSHDRDNPDKPPVIAGCDNRP